MSLTGWLVAQGALLFGLLAWQVYRVVRAPWDVPLRAVAGTVACWAVGYVAGHAAGNPTQPAGGPWLALLVWYGLVVTGAYCLVCFYLFSALDSGAARRRAINHAVILLVALSVMAATAMTAPSQHSTSHLTVFYLIADLYLALALAASFRWTRRYAQGADPRLARGLVFTSLGLAGTVVGVTLLASRVAAQGLHLAMPPPMRDLTITVLMLGILLFLVGIAYPGTVMRIAALRVWHQHRRAFAELTPLWNLLHEAFPKDALDTGWGDVHSRYYRRAMEIRDGLVRLSPYLAALGYRDDKATAPTELAHQLRQALRARAAGQEPASTRAVGVAIPTRTGLDADVAELVALARALHTIPDPESTP
ncbi:hypothetical protein GCM10012275_43660 [Longimycelium tulufanense]|uniref:DUF6545 domain-containing protein n=1 Tax=Longimycelium tulufanense TaxID=907463 RepID=A0A8J3CFM9_9PSEU|nr:MAB_1171c family putative transporter [Longimycelium tulufanense]GGM68433.1 hypothetical protein GCM10012275_43660 [Longimycelium tulufanense]